MSISEIRNFLKEWEGDIASSGGSVSLDPYRDSHEIRFVSHGCGHMMPLPTVKTTVSGTREPIVDWDDYRSKLPVPPKVAGFQLVADRLAIEPSVLDRFCSEIIQRLFNDLHGSSRTLSLI